MVNYVVQCMYTQTDTIDHSHLECDVLLNQSLKRSEVHRERQFCQGQ